MDAGWDSSKKSREAGFTLVEIAIVLVIVGLLLGGVLKGQEMINSAKVKNVIEQGDAIKSAFNTFQDRYRAMPGDYRTAVANIAPNGPALANGDGNNRVGLTGTAASPGELVQVWVQLQAAGLLSGSYDGVATSIVYGWVCPSVTCPQNAFGGTVMLSWGTESSANTALSHELLTGEGIPVAMVSEIDRKIDDGAPNTGFFTSPDTTDYSTCVTGTAPAQTWAVAAGTSNCGGVSRRL